MKIREYVYKATSILWQKSIRHLLGRFPSPGPHLWKVSLQFYKDDGSSL